MENIRTILFDYGNTLVIDPFAAVLRLNAKNLIRAMRSKGFMLEEIELISAWTGLTMKSIIVTFLTFIKRCPLLKGFSATI